MAEEFRFKEKKDEKKEASLFFDKLNDDLIKEEIIEKLEEYNEHMKANNILLYVISIILFGILCAVICI